MKVYLIVKCDVCGKLLLAQSGIRTRSCPYCGNKLLVSEAKVLAKARSSQEAKAMLRVLKAGSE